MRASSKAAKPAAPSKTTTAVSLAMTAAESGGRVVLIDLDPRAATAKWTRAEPTGEGSHVGAILGAQEDPIGGLSCSPVVLVGLATADKAQWSNFVELRRGRAVVKFVAADAGVGFADGAMFVSMNASM